MYQHYPYLYVTHEVFGELLPSLVSSRVSSDPYYGKQSQQSAPQVELVLLQA